MLSQGGHIYDLKCAYNLGQAVKKLPQGIRYRWVRFVRKLKPNPVDLQNLDVFLESIMEEERMAHLTFESSSSKAFSGEKQKKSKVPTERQRATFKIPVSTFNLTVGTHNVLSTQETDMSRTEYVNGLGAHELVSCDGILKKSPSERASFPRIRVFASTVWRENLEASNVV